MQAQGGCVLDASAAVSWMLGDAEESVQSEIDALLTGGFALVPELWHAEVANAMVRAVRVGRIDPDFIATAGQIVERLDIRTDSIGNSTLRLAATALEHGLSSYDTSYLLLARDRGLPIATLDRELARAAVTGGIRLAISPA